MVTHVLVARFNREVYYQTFIDVRRREEHLRTKVVKGGLSGSRDADAHTYWSLSDLTWRPSLLLSRWNFLLV
jgi:hypothetical protein